MAYPRSEQFDERQVSLAEAARALGHPGRLALLEELAGRPTCTCGELVDKLPLAQATVSQHLKVLKEAGFISGSIEGPRTCYCIDWGAILRVGEAFTKWFQEMGKAETCC